ncbi:MAG: GDSL-type esterase/lipase family protein [Hormoscilla sp.]
MKSRKWQRFFTLILASLLVITSCGSNINGVKNLQAGTGEQVIILGDSIASGYGVAAEQAFPNILSRKLGIPILNRGVSGDTTAMGLSRLQADVIDAEPWLVIVELAGNDYLRNVPKSQTEENLRQIVTAIQQEGAIVVLLGINAGRIGDEYKEMFDRLASDTQAYLIPQVLKGIVDNPQHRQDDIIHPNAAGHEFLATRVAEELQPLLAKAKWPATLKQFK